MKQCKKCRKKGLFLKLSDNELCADCVQKEKQMDLVVRERANIEAKYVIGLAGSIRDTVESIVTLGESGAYSSETVEYALKKLDEALTQAKLAASAVRNPDVTKIEPTIDSSKKAVEDIYKITLDLIKKTTY